MRLRSTTAPMAAALVALAVLATACEGGGSGPTGAPSAPGATTSAAADAGEGKGGKADFDTVFDTEALLRQALPDRESLKGWTPKDGNASVDEDPTPAAECGAESAWDCARVARGSVSFEGGGELAGFEIEAFADRGDAEAACGARKKWAARYEQAKVPPLPGVESHSYYRNAGGLDNIFLSLCLGTVVAEVRLEDWGGSSLDPGTLHSLAEFFVPRIEKAAAGS
ncbi:hypothetical protein [Streptomyces sp. NPDC056796]|uniref:hypothetical protein n=1 Tax=unclassified Streptomyces TaxID=2593676 RepID=UPI0036B02C18